MIRRRSSRSYARQNFAPLSRDIAERIDLPQIVDILDTIDRTYGTFLIFGPVQTFKSLIAQFIYAHAIALRPVRTLWYHATDKHADAFYDEKLSLLLDSPALTRLYADDRNTRTKSRVSLPSGEVYRLLSANVLLNRNSKSAQDIFLDESWTFDAEWFSQIADRRSSYKHFWREIHTNTGPTYGHPLDALRLSSDQREWHMRCSACARLFLPEFGAPDTPGGMRYDSKHPDFRHPDGRLNEEFIRRTVRYECPHCHTLHAYSEQTLLAMNGTALAPRGLYVAMNAAPTSGITSWHVHEIALKNWADLTIAWIKANDAKSRGDLSALEEVVRKRFARTWDINAHLRERTLRVESGYLMAARDGSPVTLTTPDGKTKTSEWPEEGKDAKGRPLRFCSVDVQLDYFVVVIRKWSRHARSRLHYCEKVTTAAHIAELCAAHGVPPERVFLDTRHDQQRVRALCARYGWRGIYGDKEKDYPHPIIDPRTGRVTGRIKRIYSEPLLIDPFQGTVHQGGAKIIEIHFSKPSALERLHLLRTLDTNDGPPLWTDADDAPEWYRTEVDAFHRIAKTSPDGSRFYEWHAGKDDHAADCECIGIIAASLAGLVGSESLDTPPPSSPGPASAPELPASA